MKIDWVTEVPVSPVILRSMQEAADQCPRIEGIRLPCEICVVLCDDEKIREINTVHRSTARSTDVLSFPAVTFSPGKTAGQEEGRLRAEYDDATGMCFLGDVVLSVPHIIRQAEEYGHDRRREAAYLLVHGICHLMGYDHMEPEDQKKMRQMEEKILSAVSLSREKNEADWLSPEDEELIEFAFGAMEKSYSPYSHYPVGAAIRAADGRIFTGCNIENAAFSAGICAERTAVFKAVSEGVTHFRAIAIVGKKPSWPCGVCRQVLNEFSDDLKILIAARGYRTEVSSLKALLPHSFGPEELAAETDHVRDCVSGAVAESPSGQNGRSELPFTEEDQGK